MLEPAIYFGQVFHKRFIPKVHELRYQVFQILIDIDELAFVQKTLSHNKFNIFSFFDQDHGPNQADKSSTLANRVRKFLSAANIENESCKIFLMAMPRVLGFVFNPISIYFVETPNGDISAVLYEVNNTFGDRHTYIITPNLDQSINSHQSLKQLHVSPFMETKGMKYDFSICIPSQIFKFRINLIRSCGGEDTKFLFANFAAKRIALDDKNLWTFFFKLPFMTMGVVFGIHWEAVKLLAKGIFLKRKPETAKSSYSVKNKANQIL